MIHQSTTMRTGWRLNLMAVSMVALALSACASRAPSVVLLSLPLDASATTPTNTASTTPIAVLRRIQIPEYLQSIQVRYRSSAHTLGEWPATRWSERLEVSLTRHLSQQLNASLSAGSVCDTQCVSTRPVSNLQVNYGVLDYVRNQSQVQAQINWVLTPPAGDSQAVKMGQLTLSEPVQSDDAAGQAAAMAKLNAQVASRIAPFLKP